MLQARGRACVFVLAVWPVIGGSFQRLWRMGDGLLEFARGMISVAGATLPDSRVGPAAFCAARIRAWLRLTVSNQLGGRGRLKIVKEYEDEAAHAAFPSKKSGRNSCIGMPVSFDTSLRRSRGTLPFHIEIADGEILRSMASLYRRPRSSLRYLRSCSIPTILSGTEIKSSLFFQ
jgi:hypothetical protein